MNNKTDFTILLLGMCIAVLLLATSCNRNGYGCQGRSKIMTRVNAIDLHYYQIETFNDSIVIYDGERKVGVVKWEDKPTLFESVLMEDNL